MSGQIGLKGIRLKDDEWVGVINKMSVSRTLAELGQMQHLRSVGTLERDWVVICNRTRSFNAELITSLCPALMKVLQLVAAEPGSSLLQQVGKNCC
jgi:hypothetical protein